MPTITDWLMVIITFVYVIATILICIFNYRSAKATHEQVDEARRQFEEENRAFLTYSFLYERKTFYGIRLVNSGKKTATNVSIHISHEFVESLKEQGFIDSLKKLENRSFILGIGQSYDFYFGSNEYRSNRDKLPLTGFVEYSDDIRSYELAIDIDTANYAAIFSVDSDMDDLIKNMKEQTKELAAIKQELKKLNRSEG